MFSHFLYHLLRDRKLVARNLALSKNIRRNLSLKDAEFTYLTASKHDFNACMELLERCGLYAVPWLQKVFKKRMTQLCGIAKDKEGKIIACDFFMFQEAEYDQDIIHEIYLAVDPQYRGLGISTKLRQFSIMCYDEGRFKAVSTLAGFNDLKALRSAQHCGFSISKSSAKPPAYYLIKYLHQKN